MKKTLSIAFAIMFLLLCFTACGKKNTRQGSEVPSMQVLELLESEETLASKIMQQQLPSDIIECFKELQILVHVFMDLVKVIQGIIYFKDTFGNLEIVELILS